MAAGCRRLTDNLCVRVVLPNSFFLIKPLGFFGLRSGHARHICRRRPYLSRIWNHLSATSKNISHQFHFAISLQTLLTCQYQSLPHDLPSPVFNLVSPRVS